MQSLGSGVGAAVLEEEEDDGRGEKMCDIEGKIGDDDDDDDDDDAIA
jgi:hypothetical protein